MGKYSFRFFGILLIASFLSIMEIGITFVWLRSDSVSALGMLSRVMGASLLFLVSIVLGIGRFSAWFKYDFKSSDKGSEQYRLALKSLGQVPSRSLAIFVVIQTVFLGFLCVLDAAFPIRPGLAGTAFCEILSIGLLNAAFVFVMYDKLASKYLFSQGLTQYPKLLRERRQEVKIFVIPVFIALMCLVFAISITLLLLEVAGGSLRGITGSSLAKGLTGFIAFMIMIVILVKLWNNTTAMVYRSIIDQLDKISSGEKDLTGRVFIASVDELGTIAGLINYFCAGLESNVVDLKAIQGKLSMTGEDLASTSVKSSDAVKGLGQEIGQIEIQNKEQTDSIIESTAAVRQISKNVESLDELIIDQSASVTEASSSIEEMVSTISSINSSIEKIAGQFDLLEKSAVSGSSLQQVTVSRINEIVEKSKALEEANKVVSLIASQTNLLAMNAAIEAAHAGSAGLGFSVVADEIRRLAETSANETKIIKKVLGEVMHTIDNMVAATNESADSFSDVAKRIAATDSLVKEVKMAVTEQREGANQILEALKTMNDITTQVRTGSKEMNEGSVSIRKEMDTLLSSTHAFSESITSMSRSAGILHESADKVIGASGMTRKTIADMDGIVSLFKTSESR